MMCLFPPSCPPSSDLHSQPAQTPASPANTLDPSQGLQPPTELFAPFNPATVPSGRNLVRLLHKHTASASERGNKRERERADESEFMEVGEAEGRDGGGGEMNSGGWRRMRDVDEGGEGGDLCVVYEMLH